MMKLTSLRIQQLLEFSPHRNIEGLRSALNRHAGVKLTREEARSLVVNGCEGEIAKITAYELGINPEYKPKTHKKADIKEKAIALPKNIKFTTSGKYQVLIIHKRERHFLGTFKTLESAVESRNKKAEELGLPKAEKRKFKGVYKKRGKYEAQIFINGKTLFLGNYNTPEEAAIAYNLKAAPIGRRINEVHI